MNASKSLAAAVTAAALVGSIGLAYAQTADSTGGAAVGSPADTSMQNSPSTSGSTDVNTQSTTTDLSNQDTSTTTLDERADRN